MPRWPPTDWWCPAWVRSQPAWRGCGQWPGLVARLDAPVLPHMGWNTVLAPPDSVLFAGIGPAERFYFVHSYAATALPLRTWDRAAPPRCAWTTHGATTFLAAVENGP